MPTQTIVTESIAYIVFMEILDLTTETDGTHSNTSVSLAFETNIVNTVFNPIEHYLSNGDNKDMIRWRQVYTQTNTRIYAKQILGR